MQLSLTVTTPSGERLFSCRVHHTKDADSRLIEPEFYQKWCGTGEIPQGDHHELELLETADTSPLPRTGVHIHTNPHSGKRFVCWTGSLQTTRHAEKLFRIWCVGMTYTLINGKDFAPFITGNMEDFVNRMENDHGIRIK